MNLIRLINCVALHTFGYRSLLVWNLFAFISISCSSMQVRNGAKDEPQGNNLKQPNTQCTNNQLNIVFKKSDYPFHRSCATTSLKTFRKLSNKDSDPNAKDPFGYTPFRLAILKFIQEVDKNRLDETQTGVLSKYRYNFFKRIANNTSPYMREKNALKIIKELLKSSNIKLDKENFTYAFSFGNELLNLSFLKHSKFSLDYIDLDNFTVINSLSRTIINNPDEDKSKIIHGLFFRVIKEAPSSNNLNLILRLLNSQKLYFTKYPIHQKNNDGLTFFGLVIKKYSKELLCDTIEDILKKIITTLLDNYYIGLASNEIKTGNNELHFVVNGYSNEDLSKDQKTFLEDIAKKLCGRDLKLENKLNKRKETPLHLAVKLKNQSMVRILLQCTDSNIKDIDGNTPLHLFPNCIEAMEELIREIERKQIDANCLETFYDSKNKNGDTPFNLLSKKVDGLSPDDLNLNQYTDCMRALYEYSSEGPLTMDNLIKYEKIKLIDAPEKLKEEICVICLLNLYPSEQKLAQTANCQKHHHLHQDCFYGWVEACKKDKNQQELTCPMCRTMLWRKEKQENKN